MRGTVEELQVMLRAAFGVDDSDSGSGSGNGNDSGSSSGNDSGIGSWPRSPH
jgi:hypothetical protein